MRCEAPLISNLQFGLKSINPFFYFFKYRACAPRRERRDVDFLFQLLCVLRTHSFEFFHGFLSTFNIMISQQLLRCLNLHLKKSICGLAVTARARYARTCSAQGGARYARVRAIFRLSAIFCVRARNFLSIISTFPRILINNLISQKL